MQRTSIYTFLLCWLVSPVSAADFDDRLEEGLHLVLTHQYTAAHLFWSDLEAERPERALEVAFYRAATLQLRMYDLDRVVEGERLEAAVKVALKLAGERRRRPDGEFAAELYPGSALGLLGMYRHLRGEYLDALRIGLEGVAHLKKARRLRPEALEPLVGLGAYTYWSGAISSRFSWLPFVKDDREAGIAMLRQVTALPQGRLVAWNQLAWALLEMERPGEAVAVCREALAVYPESRFLLWPMAEGYHNLGQWKPAKAGYQSIRRSLEAAGITGEYVYLKSLVKEAGCAVEGGLAESAVTLAERALRVNVPDYQQKRAEKFYDWAREILHSDP